MQYCNTATLFPEALLQNDIKMPTNAYLPSPEAVWKTGDLCRICPTLTALPGSTESQH